MSRSRRKIAQESSQLTQIAINRKASEEGPTRRKQWNKQDIKGIKPLTDHQKDLFQSYFQGSNIVAHGSAGSGKTFCVLYLALNDVLDPNRQYDHIVIVRSAVPSRSVGFTPGTLEEKIALYEAPYRDIVSSLLGRSSSYDDMKEAGIIKFMTTSYVRGLTWNNSVVIVDETENLSFHEIHSIITRLGTNSRIVFAGDIKQTDLTRGEKQGMSQMMDVTDNMSEFVHIEFTADDIVRSSLVKSWIVASEKLGF